MDTNQTPNLSQNLDVTRRKRRSGMKLLYVLGLIVVLALMWIWRGLYSPVTDQESAQEFSVESGTGTSAIADQLEEVELIRSAFLFKAYARVSDKAASLQAGDYVIASNATAVEILDQITGGNVVEDTIRVTIVEGWRADKMLPAFEEAGLNITQAEWDAAFISDTVEIDEKYLDGAPTTNFTWEGYLFPDTYEFAVDATAEEVVQKMVSTFERKVGEAVENIEAEAAKQDLTVYELVVLASIIEREVIDTDEREIAAGIFLQRIADSYPLQSDATVEYVTKTERVETSFAETKIESPWNTYTNTGLPPTPISSPAISAIEAVANAQYTNYYFFLTTPEGDAIFSVTYEEHLVNKGKYYPN